MIFGIHEIIDLILNALYNTLSYENVEIVDITLENDIDNYYYLRIKLKDMDSVENENIHISLSLSRDESTLKIKSVYLLMRSNSNNVITPYYYEGLKELRDALSNILCNLEIMYRDLVGYEK